MNVDGVRVQGLVNLLFFVSSYPRMSLWVFGMMRIVKMTQLGSGLGV